MIDVGIKGVVKLLNIHCLRAIISKIATKFFNPSSHIFL